MQRISRTCGAALAGALLAGGLLVAGVAAAAGEQGSAVIEERGASDHTLVLGGTAYRVTGSTELANELGGRLAFEELPSLAEGASHDEAAVWFEAGEALGTEPRPLLRVHLTGSMPR